MDVLTIQGAGSRLNGEYPVELGKLLDITSDESLTNREAHFVKTISGIRGAELIEAFLAADTALLMSLALVVLQRAGKRVSVDATWDFPVGWAKWELGAIDEEAFEEEPERPPTLTDSANGGPSSSTSSESQDGSQSPTGALA